MQLILIVVGVLLLVSYFVRAIGSWAIDSVRERAARLAPRSPYAYHRCDRPGTCRDSACGLVTKV